MGSTVGRLHGGPAEQRGLKPVIVPLGSKRPRDLCSFGPL
jgi:hypothetical protein